MQSFGSGLVSLQKRNYRFNPRKQIGPAYQFAICCCLCYFGVFHCDDLVAQTMEFRSLISAEVLFNGNIVPSKASHFIGEVGAESTGNMAPVYSGSPYSHAMQEISFTSSPSNLCRFFPIIGFAPK